MIYLDTSVALSRLFAEPRRPAARFWDQPLSSSRLLEYEVWSRVHAVGRRDMLDQEVGNLLARIEMTELMQPVLARALEPFPLPVRTLDGLHLATMDFLRQRGSSVELASYDIRMVAAAAAIGIEAVAL